MPEIVIGSIYPAALIGKTPLFGNLYMPYRLIFTSKRVIAFFPDPKKAFRSGLKVFKAYEYRSSKWKKILNEVGSSQVVFHNNEGISDDMLKPDEQHGYGSLDYDKIGGVLLRAGEYANEFNILFRPSEKVLIRGLEFSTVHSALDQVKSLLHKTPLSNKIEKEI
jgi:hypothetical protein